jgi:hypothetical protein
VSIHRRILWRTRVTAVGAAFAVATSLLVATDAAAARDADGLSSEAPPPYWIEDLEGEPDQAITSVPVVDETDPGPTWVPRTDVAWPGGGNGNVPVGGSGGSGGVGA